MKVAVVVFLSLLAIACATNWQVDSGYGVPTGVNTAPTPWNVLKFFPDNITVVQGDSISFTHRSDGHVIVFYSSVLNVIADFDNVYYDPTFLPTPPNKGLSVSDPVPILSNNVKYSSGIMVQAGQQWTASFPNTGTFFYFCLLHPGMVGFVNVLPSGSTAPQTQAAIDTQRVNAFAQINATAATLASVIKTVPVRTKRSDGTSVITVDNGYGDRNLAFSLNTFGPNEFWASVGDTINLVIKDFAGGHTIAFGNATATSEGDFYWTDILPLSNGSLQGPVYYIRSFGNNNAWAGQFVSGGILLPPGTPGPTQSTFNLTIDDALATNFVLPKRFRFLCSIHTINPDLLPVAVYPNRTYIGQVGYMTVYPRGKCPLGQDGCPTKPSAAATIAASIATLLVALLALMF